MNINDSVLSVERKRKDFKQPISVSCEIGWFFFASDKIALNGARKKHSLPMNAFCSVKVSPKKETSVILSQSSAA